MLLHYSRCSSGFLQWLQAFCKFHHLSISTLPRKAGGVVRSHIYMIALIHLARPQTKLLWLNSFFRCEEEEATGPQEGLLKCCYSISYIRARGYVFTKRIAKNGTKDFSQWKR